jgi:hypothetical protein
VSAEEKASRASKVEEVLLDVREALREFRESIRELMYALAPKCPRCRGLMALGLKPLRDEWGRNVYMLVLVCYKCNYELVSNVILSEKGA